MRPLVYDFGQLNDNTEKDYTNQIVTDRCQDIAQVMGQTNVIQSVSKILSWSQEYMRKRKVSIVIKDFAVIAMCYRMSVVLLA